MAGKKESYENLQNKIRHIKTLKIDTIKNMYPEKTYTITIETDEFTCMCPKTSLPDFAHVCIKYIPGKLCVELKSFKLYLYSYRNIGIFHENAVNKIFDDFIHTAKPQWACIALKFKTRGGIDTTVEREYSKRV